MESSQLIRLMDCLYSKCDKSNMQKYAVPKLWNTWGYQDSISSGDEILVNPYHFYYEVINSYILPKKKDQNYSLPYYQLNENMILDDKYIGGDWIKKSVVYSMMIRTSSAWDHNKNGELDLVNNEGFKETGTFIKTLVLLPLLKKMGVDVLYLLPISKYSTKDKKGELGSPYGVSNFMAIDPNLKDSITGNEFTVEDEFKAFVEACHILDIKVMIDIIPRTNAIENDLIIDHPDWFYWIKSEEFSNYAPPLVSSLGRTVSPSYEVIEEVYKSESVWNHLSKFTVNPKEIDPIKYENLVKQYNDNPNLLFTDLIKEEFKVQIAPAFSDHINDPQPPWTDITFFRMYEDHPTISKDLLNKYYKPSDEVPPYILFDTIKCNLYQGNIPNLPLWDMLSNIIPYYQTQFGIDGARIDMGHALSSDLLNMIISSARNIDKNFCFIAEELNSGNALSAKEKGYNMIIGDGFWHEPRYYEGRLTDFIKRIATLPCPVFACGETHDTPRLAARHGERRLSRMLTFLNMFIPNGIPFINSGQEVYERQPMNTGLDVEPNALLMLEENDPFYQKLALFDKYAFHYTNVGYQEIPNYLEELSTIRQEYIKTITNRDNYVILDSIHEKLIVIAYLEEEKRENYDNNILLVLTNIDLGQEVYLNLDLTSLLKNNSTLAKQLFSQYHNETDTYNINNNRLELVLKPGEFKLLKL